MASRSLGVLTLDLVAKTGSFEQGLDRAGRAAAKQAKDIEQAQRRAAQAIDGTIEGMALEVAMLGKSAREQDLYKLAMKGATAEQLKQVEAAYDAIDAFHTQEKAVREAAAAQAKAAEEAADIAASQRQKIVSDVKAIGKALAGAGTAVAAGVTALAVQQVQAAAEISRLSQIAGAGTTEFQRYAAAADVAGISQEKLSDQLKDFNEKLGEFQQSGAGGMKDFFEQIAPQIGVTADAFRDLSGPQALQLYYDSLERAGLSQQQMSFYLESMASDTTALIPLLKDGGAGFKLLGDEAERAGAIMNEETISAADKLSAATLVATNAATGLRNTVGAQLLPVLSELAVEFSEATNEGALAEEVASTLAGTFRVLAASAMGAFGAVQIMVKGVKGVSTLTDTEAWYENIVPPLLARRIYKNWQENREALGAIGDDIEATFDRYAELTKKLYQDGTMGGGEGDSLIDRLAQFREDMRKWEGGSSGSGIGIISEEAKKAQKAIADEITALERAAITWGMTADEVKLYGLELDGATGAQLRRASAALEDVAAMEKAKEQQEAYLELVKDLRTDEEKLTDQLHERLAVLDAIAAAGGVGSDEYQETARRIVDGGFAESPDFGGLAPEVGGPFSELDKIDEAQEKLQEWYDTQLEMLEQNRQDRADLNAEWDEKEAELHQEHQDKLADIERARQQAQMAAGEEFFGNMAGAAKAFFGENSKLYQAAFAVEKAYAIGKALMNVPKSYSDAFAAVVGIPIVGPVLAPAAGVAAAGAQVAQAAAIGNINMTGMAHEGIMSVPKTGTWLLEEGERVTTAQTSAAMDATLARVNQNLERGGSGSRVIINEAPPGTTVEERLGADGAEEFVVDLRSGGTRSRALESFYGLRRVGR